MRTAKYIFSECLKTPNSCGWRDRRSCRGLIEGPPLAAGAGDNALLAGVVGILVGGRQSKAIGKFSAERVIATVSQPTILRVPITMDTSSGPEKLDNALLMGGPLNYQLEPASVAWTASA